MILDNVPFMRLLVIVWLAFIGCTQAETRFDESTLGQPKSYLDDAPLYTPPASAEKAGSRDSVNAVLWVQKSREYRAVTRQIYRCAMQKVDKALVDKKWTAALEQKNDYAHLAPAVILDIDETVLDNSPYQGRLILGDASFSPDSWDCWIKEHKAKAIPGAKAFVRYATRRGIQVFYISNRQCRKRCDDSGECPQEKDTIANLESLGFPKIPENHVLLQGEKEAWNSDKSSRRQFLSKKYRILLIMGDQLGDFISDSLSKSEQPRGAKRDEYDSYWGSKWFILPNPAYGSWLKSLSPDTLAEIVAE